MSTVTEQATTPVFVSDALTSPTGAVQSVALACVRSTNVTSALRMSPGKLSVAGSPVTAEMSRTVALSASLVVATVPSDQRNSAMPPRPDALA